MNLERLGTAVLIASAALAATSNSASATVVKECGNYGFVEGQGPDRDGKYRPHFTDEPINGAGIFKIQAAVTTCVTARRVVRDANAADSPCYPAGRRPPSSCRIRGFVCRTKQLGEEYARIRCATPDDVRVVIWRAGA